MTNEEAIKFLSQIMGAILASNSWLPSTDNPIKESFGMAINALEAQEKAQEVSNNSPELDKENGELISRKEAINALDCINGAEEVLRSLPSAPQRTGHWIEDDDEMCVICSECGEKNDYISAYCPDCGARMEDNNASD